jgi:hypothetical protein
MHMVTTLTANIAYTIKVQVMIDSSATVGTLTLSGWSTRRSLAVIELA